MTTEPQETIDHLTTSLAAVTNELRELTVLVREHMEHNVFDPQTPTSTEG